jgi:serine/threonine protein kinase
LQIQQYYADIKKLKEHIHAHLQKAGTMMKSTSEFYRIGRVLGRGAFGKVNLACHKVSEHLVAIKSIEYAVLRNEKEHKRRLM